MFELYCTPVHLNEVEFTVVFGIKITNMSLALNKFLKCRFLVCKIWLVKENPPTATVSYLLLTFETRALGQEPISPKVMFFHNLFHSLKPAWHCRVVLRPIKIFTEFKVPFCSQSGLSRVHCQKVCVSCIQALSLWLRSVFWCVFSARCFI
jgi:hypothetical protein